MTETLVPPRDLTIAQTAGPALRAWHWARPNSAATIVISHGLGEHADCYRHVAETLGPRLNIDFLAFDYRGHGRSPGARGVVSRYEELVADLKSVLVWQTNHSPGQSCFVLGHSNGGQVLLRALLDGLKIDGAILSNPYLRLAMSVPRYKRWVGELLLRVAPGVTLSSALNDGTMTRDPAMLAGRGDDPLRHTRINAPFFFGMVDGGLEIAARAPEIHTPILLLLGQKDPVVDAEFSRQVFGQLGTADKTLRLYPESLHEPLNDLDRDQVLDDIADWIAPRCAPR